MHILKCIGQRVGVYTQMLGERGQKAKRTPGKGGSVVKRGPAIANN